MPRSISLDTRGRIGLEPDLIWWSGHSCELVGDAKYQRIDDGAVPNADLYQIFAYAAALNLPSGLLIYAKGEAEPVEHVSGLSLGP